MTKPLLCVILYILITHGRGLNKENIRNSKKRTTNTSGTTGVSWAKRESKWSSYIMVDYKKKHLGYFTNKKEAIKARKEGEIKYFGEFRKK